MRRYLILVNNIQQAENIVDLFDDGYTKRKHYNSDYVIIKNDESVVYDILLSGKNHYYYRVIDGMELLDVVWFRIIN